MAEACNRMQYVGHGYVIPCAMPKPCPIHGRKPAPLSLPQAQRGTSPGGSAGPELPAPLFSQMAHRDSKRSYYEGA